MMDVSGVMGFAAAGSSCLSICGLSNWDTFGPWEFDP
jgi:hypothetical protein